jgi:hypothetical protein
MGLLPTFPLLVAESFEVDDLIEATSDTVGLGSLELGGSSFATLAVFVGAGIRSSSEVAFFEDDPISFFGVPCSVTQRICRKLLAPSFPQRQDEQVHLQHSYFLVLI